MNKKAIVVGITLLIVSFLIIFFKPFLFIMEKDAYIYKFSNEYEIIREELPGYIEINAKAGVRYNYKDCQIHIISVTLDEIRQEWIVVYQFEQNVGLREGSGLGPKNMFVSLSTPSIADVSLVIEGEEYFFNGEGSDGYRVTKTFCYDELPFTVPQNTNEVTIRLYDLVYTTYKKK